MGKNPLQEILNKLFRDPAINQREYIVVIADRLESSGAKMIPLNHIYNIDRFGIESLGSDYIPLHRIICIKHGDNIIWERARKSD